MIPQTPPAGRPWVAATAWLSDPAGAATALADHVQGAAGFQVPVVASALAGQQVNGYDTTKYSVDTTRLDATQTSILLGAGSFIKGTAWVTSDGCPVKMTLDEELHNKDGSVAKSHYDEAIVKK